MVWAKICLECALLTAFELIGILEADELATRAIKKPKKGGLRIFFRYLLDRLLTYACIAGDGSVSDDQMSGDIPCDMSTGSQNGKFLPWI